MERKLSREASFLRRFKEVSDKRAHIKHTVTSDEIAMQTEAFLRRGGKVQVAPVTRPPDPSDKLSDAHKQKLGIK